MTAPLSDAEFNALPDAPPFDERDYRRWYEQDMGRQGDPDDPRHWYDHRAAYESFKRGEWKPEYVDHETSPGVIESIAHMPSQYKHKGHPNRFVEIEGQLIDTITNEPATEADVEESARIRAAVPLSDEEFNRIPDAPLEGALNITQSLFTGAQKAVIGAAKGIDLVASSYMQPFKDEITKNRKWQKQLSTPFTAELQSPYKLETPTKLDEKMKDQRRRELWTGVEGRDVDDDEARWLEWINSAAFGGVKQEFPKPGSKAYEDLIYRASELVNKRVDPGEDITDYMIAVPKQYRAAFLGILHNRAKVYGTLEDEHKVRKLMIALKQGAAGAGRSIGYATAWVLDSLKGLGMSEEAKRQMDEGKMGMGWLIPKWKQTEEAQKLQEMGMQALKSGDAIDLKEKWLFRQAINAGRMAPPLAWSLLLSGVSAEALATKLGKLAVAGKQTAFWTAMIFPQEYNAMLAAGADKKTAGYMAWGSAVAQSLVEILEMNPWSLGMKKGFLNRMREVIARTGKEVGIEEVLQAVISESLIQNASGKSDVNKIKEAVSQAFTESVVPIAILGAPSSAVQLTRGIAESKEASREWYKAHGNKQAIRKMLMTEEWTRAQLRWAEKNGIINASEFRDKRSREALRKRLAELQSQYGRVGQALGMGLPPTDAANADYMLEDAALRGAFDAAQEELEVKGVEAGEVDDLSEIPLDLPAMPPIETEEQAEDAFDTMRAEQEAKDNENKRTDELNHQLDIKAYEEKKQEVRQDFIRSIEHMAEQDPKKAQAELMLAEQMAKSLGMSLDDFLMRARGFGIPGADPGPEAALLQDPKTLHQKAYHGGWEHEAVMLVQSPKGKQTIVPMDTKLPKGTIIVKKFPLGRPSSDKIMSGEGDLDQGWGLYYTETLDVGDEYYKWKQERIRQDPMGFKFDGKPIWDMFGENGSWLVWRIQEGWDNDKLVAGADKWVESSKAELDHLHKVIAGKDKYFLDTQLIDAATAEAQGAKGPVEVAKKMLPIYQKEYDSWVALRDFSKTLNRDKLEIPAAEKNPALYEVWLNPKGADWNVWYLPFSEQSKKVQKAWTRIANRIERTIKKGKGVSHLRAAIDLDMRGDRLYWALVNDIKHPNSSDYQRDAMPPDLQKLKDYGYFDFSPLDANRVHEMTDEAVIDNPLTAVEVASKILLNDGIRGNKYPDSFTWARMGLLDKNPEFHFTHDPDGQTDDDKDALRFANAMIYQARNAPGGLSTGEAVERQAISMMQAEADLPGSYRGKEARRAIEMIQTGQIRRRRDEKPTHNFVVFNDEDVQITRRLKQEAAMRTLHQRDKRHNKKQYHSGAVFDPVSLVRWPDGREELVPMDYEPEGVNILAKFPLGKMSLEFLSSGAGDQWQGHAGYTADKRGTSNYYYNLKRNAILRAGAHKRPPPITKLRYKGKNYSEHKAVQKNLGVFDMTREMWMWKHLSNFLFNYYSPEALSVTDWRKNRRELLGKRIGKLRGEISQLEAMEAGDFSEYRKYDDFADQHPSSDPVEQKRYYADIVSGMIEMEAFSTAGLGTDFDDGVKKREAVAKELRKHIDGKPLDAQIQWLKKKKKARIKSYERQAAFVDQLKLEDIEHEVPLIYSEGPGTFTYKGKKYTITRSEQELQANGHFILPTRWNEPSTPEEVIRGWAMDIAFDYLDVGSVVHKSNIKNKANDAIERQKRIVAKAEKMLRMFEGRHRYFFDRDSMTDDERIAIKHGFDPLNPTEQSQAFPAVGPGARENVQAMNSTLSNTADLLEDDNFSFANAWLYAEATDEKNKKLSQDMVDRAEQIAQRQRETLAELEAMDPDGFKFTEGPSKDEVLAQHVAQYEMAIDPRKDEWVLWDQALDVQSPYTQAKFKEMLNMLPSEWRKRIEAKIAPPNRHNADSIYWMFASMFSMITVVEKPNAQHGANVHARVLTPYEDFLTEEINPKGYLKKNDSLPLIKFGWMDPVGSSTPYETTETQAKYEKRARETAEVMRTIWDSLETGIDPTKQTAKQLASAFFMIHGLAGNRYYDKNTREMLEKGGAFKNSRAKIKKGKGKPGDALLTAELPSAYHPAELTTYEFSMREAMRTIDEQIMEGRLVPPYKDAAGIADQIEYRASMIVEPVREAAEEAGFKDLGEWAAALGRTAQDAQNVFDKHAEENVIVPPEITSERNRTWQHWSNHRGWMLRYYRLMAAAKALREGLIGVKEPEVSYNHAVFDVDNDVRVVKRLRQKAYHGGHIFKKEMLVEHADGTREFMELGKAPEGATVIAKFPYGRLRLDKIFSGTGGIAQGHGLYFADLADVSRWYRDLIDEKSGYNYEGENRTQDELTEILNAMLDKIPVETVEFTAPDGQTGEITYTREDYRKVAHDVIWDLVQGESHNFIKEKLNRKINAGKIHWSAPPGTMQAVGEFLDGIWNDPSLQPNKYHAVPIKGARTYNKMDKAQRDAMFDVSRRIGWLKPEKYTQEEAEADVRLQLRQTIVAQQERLDGGDVFPPLEGKYREQAETTIQEARDALDVLDSGLIKIVMPVRSGQLYEVDLKPEPHEWLQWDLPLNQQPEFIKQALLRLKPKMLGPNGDALHSKMIDSIHHDDDGVSRKIERILKDIRKVYDQRAAMADLPEGEFNREAYDKLSDQLANLEEQLETLPTVRGVAKTPNGGYSVMRDPPLRGQSLYTMLTGELGRGNRADAALTSQLLHSVGIRGNRYFDNVTRKSTQARWANPNDEYTVRYSHSVKDLVSNVYTTLRNRGAEMSIHNAVNLLEEHAPNATEKEKPHFAQAIEMVKAGRILPRKDTFNYVLFDDSDVEIVRTLEQRTPDGKEPWEVMRDDYIDNKRPLDGEGPGDPAWESDYARRSKLREIWNASMKRALSLGRIDSETAVNRGFSSLEEYKPLPETLYHVTTAKEAVLAEGLKTREELEMGAGRGLGGGDSDTISFTESEETAIGILNAMREARRVARGEFTIEQMIEEARTGHRAERPWLNDWLGIQGGEAEEGKYPPPIQDALDGIMRDSETVEKLPSEMPGWTPVEGSNYGRKDGKYFDWTRPMTAAEQRQANFRAFTGWLSMRESAGGPLNPLFYLSDPNSLAETKASDIDLVIARPVPGGSGFQMSSLGEWRTNTGDAVIVQGQRRLPNHLRQQEPPQQPPEPDGGDVKGSITFYSDGTSYFQAFENADVSTFLHEMAHYYRRMLVIDHYNHKQEGRPGKSRLEVAAEWAGVVNFLSEDPNDKHGWTEEAEEKIARGFEKYMATQQAPSRELKTLFDHFRQWMADIYAVIEGSEIDINITPEMKAVFDSWFVGSTQGATPTSTVEGAKEGETSPSTARAPPNRPEPEPVPVGGLPYEVVQSPAWLGYPDDATSGRNAMNEAQRNSLIQFINKGDLPSPEQESFNEWLKQAINTGEDKEADRKARGILEGLPRMLTHIEQAGFIVRIAQLKKQHGEIMAQIENASNAADLAFLSKDAQEVEQAYDNLVRANKIAGTEAARSLVSRKLTIDEDMTLLPVLQRARAAKGDFLTDKQEAILKDITDRVAKAEADAKRIEDKQKRKVVNEQIKAQRKGGARAGSSQEYKNKDYRGLTEKIKQMMEHGCADGY